MPKTTFWNSLKNYQRILIVSVLSVLAFLQFLRVQNPFTHPEKAIDFRNIYLASTLWGSNKSCYSDQNIKEKWNEISKHENLEANVEPGLPHNAVLYPPITCIVFKPITLMSYSNAVVVFKLFWILFFLLCIWFLYKTLLLYEYPLPLWLCFLLWLSLKPIVNMFNVGQISILFFALFFWVTSRQKLYALPSFLFGLISSLKPTVGISMIGPMTTKSFKNALWFFFGITLPFLLFLIPYSNLIQDYLYQAQGQVFNAYANPMLVYPTFESMSNCQLESVFYLFGGTSAYSVFTILRLPLLLLFGIAGIYLWFKNNKALLVPYVVCFVLVFSYHKYYDSLLLLPFLIMFILSKNHPGLKYWSLVFLLHLLLPYNFLKTVGISENFTNNLQFNNSILPLIGLILLIFYGLAIPNKR